MISIHDTFAELCMHLIEDGCPSKYFNAISVTPLFAQYPFMMLGRLKQTEQSPKHHPEGSVWNHTMLVLDEAAKVKSESHNEKAFMWAALLHDIGKPDTTKNNKGKITSYDHDKKGAELTRKFLIELSEDEAFIETVAGLVRWHMQILFVVNNLPFADVNTMIRQTDFKEIALLGLCDRLGRVGANRSQEENNIKVFIQNVKHHNSIL